MKYSKNIFIAIDFDGTITRENVFPDIGEIDMRVIKFLQYLNSVQNVKLALWTCRHDKALQQAVEICSMHGIKFDAINDDFAEIKAYGWGEGRKIYADYYIDDRSVISRQYLYALIDNITAVIADRQVKN